MRAPVMSLATGSRVGPYEILGAIGAGGMGEVYRARDARLHRDVAVKALPELFSLDPDRVARFEREAQLLAALNHPNIAGIHGLEESGGERYLILELIPGESLATRLASGPLVLGEALALARQLAEALEAAHEKDIVHRDLKPGNIMVTPEGQVKVLDFGLAKGMHPAGAGLSPSSPGTPSSPGPFPNGLHNSPTFASPAQTQMGVILGTAAYMSPEQAKGRTADKRSDVWAFGCVVYELLTGTTAFGGDDIPDTLAAVLRGEPDWTKLPPATPPAIERLLRRCLHKDRKQRLPDISIARYEIDEWLAGRTSQTSLSAASRRPRWQTAAMLGGAAVLGAAAATAVLRFGLWPSPAPPIVARFEVKPPADTRPIVAPIGSGTDIVISPDGTRVAYRAASSGGAFLALRRLEEHESTILPGTLRGGSPSFSPGGDRLAFVSQNQLKVLTLGAAAPTAVCDVASSAMGTDWLDEETILFAQGGIFRVPAGGGTPAPIAQPADDRHAYLFPEVLPGGTAILFTIDGPSGRRIAARRLDSGEQKIVAENASFAHFAEPGYIAFMQAGRFVAARFDRERLEIIGTPATISENLMEKITGAAGFDLSTNGVFAGMEGNSLPFVSRFFWKARDGRILGFIGETDLEYPRYPRISPDGRRLAGTVGPGSQGQIWVFDLAGTAQPLKLTFGQHNLWPSWTPDGRGFLFTRIVTDSATDSGGYGRMAVMLLPADGSTLTPKPVLKIPDGSTSVTSISPDGKWILFTANLPGTLSDLMLKAIDTPDPPRPWLNESFSEAGGEFSRDGRWVAYVSTQTGTPEIWVRPFPGPGAPIRISPSTGREPVWSWNGKELFYQENGKMMAVAVNTTGAEFVFESPRMLFQGGFVAWQEVTPRTYDVAPDGRFLMIEEKPNPNPAIVTVVTGWTEMLASRLPR